MEMVGRLVMKGDMVGWDVGVITGAGVGPLPTQV
jgi:hypothetical protein